MCPSANSIIKYTKKETGGALDGDSAVELAAHNYGRDEWWVLSYVELRSSERKRWGLHAGNEAWGVDFCFEGAGRPETPALISKNEEKLRPKTPCEFL